MSPRTRRNVAVSSGCVPSVGVPGRTRPTIPEPAHAQGSRADSARHDLGPHRQRNPQPGRSADLLTGKARRRDADDRDRRATDADDAIENGGVAAETGAASSHKLGDGNRGAHQGCGRRPP